MALLALCLAGAVIQLDVSIVNVALPTIQHQLQASPDALEWVISGYALGLAALIPLMGALGDRLGHRSVLMAGLVVFGLCSAAAALATSPAVLVAARVGQGVGGSAIVALSIAALTDTYPPDERGRAIGWWVAMASTGFAAGPVVGGVLLSTFGWSSIFWVNAPLTLAAAGLILRAVPRGVETSEPRPLDVPGVMLASLGLAAVVYGLTTATDRPWHPARTLLPLLVGGLVLAAFVQWQRRAADPLVPRGVRRSSAFVGACVVYLISYAAFTGALYYVTLLLQNLHGWSVLHTGLSWLFLVVPFQVGAQLAGRLSERRTPRSIVTSGCAAGALGFATLGAMTSRTPFVVTGLGFVAMGVGYGLLVPGITHAAMGNMPTRIAGSAAAVLNSSRQVGAAAGLALVGSIGSAVTHHTWATSRIGHTAPASLATGNLRGVPPPLRTTARHAFEAGYHAAVGVCAVGLLVAVWIALQAFKQPKTSLEGAESPLAEPAHPSDARPAWHHQSEGSKP